MFFSPLFAIQDLKVDPEITKAFAYLMGLLLIVGMGFIAWHSVPVLIDRSRTKRAAKIKAANSIWFDTKESVLHCGHNKKYIEPNSFEYFVCRATFKAPSKYHSDSDVFEDAERAKRTRETRRGVEQAVRRLNQKARKLGLRNDLFKRSKERTSVNDEYRQCIVK